MDGTPARVSLAMPFRSVQHVYFDDLDALNILHNVRYLLFMERARGELFNALGFRWEDDITVNPDKMHVVAAHEIQYLRPVRGEGDVCVALSPTHLGRTSVTLEATVESLTEGTCYARGSTRLVRLDPDSQRPCPWSQRFRDLVGRLVTPPR